MQDVIFTEDIATKVKEVSAGYSEIAVLVDENTVNYCYPLITQHLSKHVLIEIVSGENHKNIESCSLIWNALTNANFSRHALLINLGGGVIGDMGGFCAATYKRGINFINIPTTLLAQVDASVGGKLGIDFRGFKNHIGLFKQPEKVLMDQVFLQTLPSRELKSGYAEIIKHAIISDKEEWSLLTNSGFENLKWTDIIKRSVSLKSKVVSEDVFESGLRKTLNFGHTIGHAIESFYLNSKNRLLHGEAISIGMICESFIAYKKGMLSISELEEIRNHIIEVFGKKNIEANNASAIIELCKHDKKNRNEEILACLPVEIGKAQWDISIIDTEISDSLNYYHDFQM